MSSLRRRDALEGVTELDLTRLLPGAFCSQMMADMGAEVIKVEDPRGGDYNRAWEPKAKNIWYRGRLDDIINSASYRIGPSEVENALLEYGAVAECAVVGKPDAARGEIVKAYVVPRPGRNGDAQLATELQDHCKHLTAPHKYLREIAFVESLRKTLTGKIKRSEPRDRERTSA